MWNTRPRKLPVHRSVGRTNREWIRCNKGKGVVFAMQGTGRTLGVVWLRSFRFTALAQYLYRLQFDQPIQTNLLHAVSRMGWLSHVIGWTVLSLIIGTVSFSSRRLNRWTVNWNRLVLLWGPPGTGKTSFWYVHWPYIARQFLTSSSRGLSQKLAIRLGKHYPRSKLIEINAHTLGSKFFGESSKLVSKAFENIELLLEEEEETLVSVFVDEVETLAGRRDRALRGNEPFDAVRAVNALLTGLDRLNNYPNVIVICTSNLITALVSICAAIEGLAG